MMYMRPGFVCRPPLLVVWNQQDKTDKIDVSGGLLTAIANASGDGAVRCSKVRGAGSWYAELNGSTIGGSDTGMGFANASAVLATLGTTANNVFMQFRSGNVYKNGSLVFSNGNMSGGGIIRAAYNGTTHKAWLAFGAGNWNANASNDPATGVGGQDVSAIDGAGLFLCFSSFTSGDTCVLNAGATSFTYTLPATFSNWNAS